MDKYATLSKQGYSEYEEKKSLFIGNAIHVGSEDEGLSFIKDIKSKYYDAKHNVYAYLLNDGKVRCSDDGEPQGSAGVPTLDCIKKSNIVDACVVVTRYFGGILLGTGGLLRAYTKAASSAINEAGIVVYDDYDIFSVKCSYSDYQKISYEISKSGAVIDKIDYAENVIAVVSIKSEIAESLKKNIYEITAGKTMPELIGKRVGPASDQL